MSTWNVICWWIIFYALLYIVPYLIRKGWGDAVNRTKKLCDVCWRDINKVNEKLKDL